MLLKWILILTLSTAGTTNGGKAIHSVEFASQDSCEVAGKSWQSKLPQEDKRMSSFVCVKNEQENKSYVDARHTDRTGRRDDSVSYGHVMGDSQPKSSAEDTVGLPEKSEALEDVSSDKAQNVLEAVLARNMAYKYDAMPRDRAAQLAKEFIESQLPNTRFFVNGDWTIYLDGSQSAVFSWNNLTDATFDAGVVAVSDQLAMCIWVEDED